MPSDDSRLDQDHRISLVLKFFDDQLDKPNDDRWSIHHIAQEFDIPYTTFWGRLNGRKPLQFAHESQQKLSVPEEEELLNFTLKLSDSGLPLSPRLLKQAAHGIARRRDPEAVMGKNWSYRFRKRHQEFLDSKFDTHLPKSRARAVTTEMICEWFSIVSVGLTTNFLKS